MDDISLNGKRPHRRYYAQYTIAFAAVAVLAFSVYIFTGRTLIWNADAWSQHYKALIYYAEYLRTIIKTLFTEGHLSIPNWDFSFGEGGDVLTTLHYYVIGDPLTALSVLVPSRFLHIFYDALSILRMYLSGIAFSYFCFLVGQKSERAVAIGSLTYVFSYWAIVNAGRHSYFLNPMLYFPLLLIGVEFILRGRRPYLFIVAVTISAISNFYFFYMLAVLTAFYVICRIIFSVRSGERRLPDALRSLFKIAGGSVLGVVMSAIVLMPVTMAFLGDTRAGVDYDVGVFYPLIYYTKLPALIAGDGGGDYWICAGYSVVAFPALILMFRERGGGLLKFFAISAMTALCFPIFGQVLNGFSYVTNRWSWAAALVASFIVVKFFDKLANITPRDYLCVVVAESVILILCLIFGESRNFASLSAMAVAFVMLIILLPCKNASGEPLLPGGLRVRVLMLIACFSMVWNSLSFTAPWGYDYVSEHMPWNGIYKRLYNNETAIIKSLAEKDGVDGFFRYSGPSMAQNAGAITGLSSTQYFWSLSNPSVTERNIELGLRDYWIFRYSGADGRTAMNTLASVRYYVIAKSGRAPIPYGYEPINDEATGAYQLYENKNALPLAYSYDRVIAPDVWDTLTAYEKEEAMLYGAYIDDAEPELPELDELDAADALSCKDVKFTVKCPDTGVTYEDGKFVVTDPKSTVTFVLDRVNDADSYMYLSGFSFKATPEYDLYLGGEDVDPTNAYSRDMWEALPLSERMQKTVDKAFWKEPTSATLSVVSGFNTNTLTWYGSGYQFYNGRDDFVVNLGYHRRGISLMTVTFSRAGVYTFDEMKIVSRPADVYAPAAAALAEDTLNGLTIGRDTVSGSISLDKPKLLSFSIPYSEGWHAYVDGRETELYRANISYMAVMLEAGEHTVELRYDTPYLRLGMCISAAGLGVFAVTVCVTETVRSGKRRKKGEVA